MAILNFNYNRAVNQARQVESIAEEMLNVSNQQFQTSIDAVSMSWRGDASDQFLNGCGQIQADVQATAKELQNLAGRMREAARIIKEAEERARERLRQQAAQNSGGGSK